MRHVNLIELSERSNSLSSTIEELDEFEEFLKGSLSAVDRDKTTEDWIRNQIDDIRSSRMALRRVQSASELIEDRLLGFRARFDIRVIP